MISVHVPSEECQLLALLSSVSVTAHEERNADNWHFLIYMPSAQLKAGFFSSHSQLSFTWYRESHSGIRPSKYPPPQPSPFCAASSVPPHLYPSVPPHKCSSLQPINAHHCSLISEH
ncbi:unnamed protein product [Staurois parvus]|uniref:Uncharacterized protein n=1 Tax=Staurois parvus TaxID=386267 RepID=A0ABN9BAD9_9NEOB|nr:unnamed protein product [Staurois parvus]